ncbi:SDR family NAD(P)-dependent oxidoreductase, partial [Staphylococcus aureus]
LLAELGADVVAVDRADEAPELSDRAEGLPGRIEYRCADVASEEDWDALAASLEGRRVRGLVNNAGITHRARIGELSRDD